MPSVRACVAALSAAALVAACSGSSGGKGPDTTTGTFQGLVPTPAIPLPTTTLKTTDDTPYPLASTAGGKVTLLFFGYTNCPDECPTTMAEVATALRKLPADVRNKVRVVFASSDPARDTGPVLAKWLAGFAIPATTVGLRGTVAEVDKAGSEANVPLFPPQKQADGSVAVDHGAQLIGYTAAGKGVVEWLVAIDQVGTLARQLEHDLPLLIDGQQ